MPIPPHIPSVRRLSRWRQFTRRRALERHPVSMSRERFGIISLCLIVLGLAWYGLTTRDASIRARAEEFLREATGGEVYVKSARFRMFSGITLEDVCVSVRYDERLDPHAKSPKSREIFSAKLVRLVHNPWRLLLGSLRVERVIASGPRITLVHNVDTDVRNWQLLEPPERKPNARKTAARPYITLRAATAAIVSVDAKGHRESDEERLDADVRPSVQTETGYCIEVRRLSEPAERTTVVFDPGAQILTNTPFVDARTVRLQLPKVAQEFFERISLEGEVKLSRMAYNPSQTDDRDTEVELRRVNCKIPLSMLGTSPDTPQTTTAPAETAVEMTDVRGILDLRRDRLDVDISGRINHADCFVRGNIIGSESHPEQIGVDLEIQSTDLAAPEGRLRKRLLTDSRVPETLRAILADYDPHGLFDLRLHVQRPRGAGQPVTLTGYFEPKGASGSATAFPYRLDQLHGRVRFDPPDILVEQITGYRDGAIVSVDATIDESKAWSDVQLAIDGVDVPLNSTLLDVLPGRYRTIWERFNPQGWANITVRGRRPAEGKTRGAQPWQTGVIADLVDAHLLLTDFPYPLEDVTGRIAIEGDRIEVRGVSGRHDTGTVQFEGLAELSGVSINRAEVHVEAKSLQMDDALAAALPPEGRGAFEQFQPEGKFDIRGMIAIGPGAEGLRYSLTASLCDAALRYQPFPFRLDGVQGEIVIQPEGFSVLDISGQHGSTQVTARGDVRRLDDGYEADLVFDADDLILNDDLRQSLPASLEKVWQAVQPQGRLSIRSALHLTSRNGQTQQHHRTRIEAVDAALCLKAFPLPLTHVNAQLMVSDDRVEILSLKGTHGDGAVELAGVLDFTDPGPRGSLTVKASGLVIDDKLIAALPPKLRDLVTTAHPVGTIGLDFDPLVFVQDAAGAFRWDASGRLMLSGVSANLGVTADDLTGHVKGALHIEPDGGVSLAGSFHLDTATLADWDLTELQGGITVDPESRSIDIRDAVAGAYGGEVTGAAAIRLHPNDVSYQASIVARDLKLRSFLASLGGETDERTHGTIRGNLILQGRTGNSGYREGAGELFVSEAQVWRMPIVFAIFQVLNLTPDENVFHDGWIKYFISRDTLTFQKIDLQGRAVSFVGGGRMDMHSKQLDVRLLAGSPLRLRLPVLTDLLEGASRELMEVRLTGTFKEPTIEPQPLKSLAKALKRIFPEPPRTESGRPTG